MVILIKIALCAEYALKMQSRIRSHLSTRSLKTPNSGPRRRCDGIIHDSEWLPFWVRNHEKDRFPVCSMDIHQLRAVCTESLAFCLPAYIALPKYNFFVFVIRMQYPVGFANRNGILSSSCFQTSWLAWWKWRYLCQWGALLGLLSYLWFILCRQSSWLCSQPTWPWPCCCRGLKVRVFNTPRRLDVLMLLCSTVRHLLWINAIIALLAFFYHGSRGLLFLPWILTWEGQGSSLPFLVDSSVFKSCFLHCSTLWRCMILHSSSSCFFQWTF